MSTYITLEPESTSYYGAAHNVSSISWNHNCSGADNQRLLVVVTGSDTSTGYVATGITYNGVALTQLYAKTQGDTHEEMWYLLAPASGNHAITITYNGTIHRTGGGAISYRNADQYNPFNDYDYSAVSNGYPLVSLVTTIDGCHLVEGTYHSQSSANFNSGQTSIFRSVVDGQDVLGGSYKNAATAGSYTMGWAYGSGGNAVTIAAAVAPAKNPEINVSDTITLSEELDIKEDRQLVAEDSITVSEDLLLKPITNVVKSESVTVSENRGTTVRSGLSISIWYEEIVVTEHPEFPGPRDEIIFTDVHVSEKVTVKIVNNSDEGVKPSFNVSY
jgi:hypothetical protein